MMNESTFTVRKIDCNFFITSILASPPHLIIILICWLETFHNMLTYSQNLAAQSCFTWNSWGRTQSCWSAYHFKFSSVFSDICITTHKDLLERYPPCPGSYLFFCSISRVQIIWKTIQNSSEKYFLKSS